MIISEDVLSQPLLAGIVQLLKGLTPIIAVQSIGYRCRNSFTFPHNAGHKFAVRDSTDHGKMDAV